MHLISLADPTTWPRNLVGVLERHETLFQAWFTGHPVQSVAAFDAAHADVRGALDTCEVIGWHCTRLTDAEIALIEADGMRLPNVQMLNERIDRLVETGQIAAPIAYALKGTNQAGDENRAGRLWFCFFAPREAGESGIHRFFRHWGGEALYNSHEKNNATSPALASIGTPCVVEAAVQIRTLSQYSFVTQSVIKRFLWAKGHFDPEPEIPEGYTVASIKAGSIKRVIRHPDLEFMLLTGCKNWQTSI
jgi:hypothetical protein